MEFNMILVQNISEEKEYVRAVSTDIVKTWREKYNYTPASEIPEIKAKHDHFKNLRQV
jgi:hypothetical protein